MWLVHCHCQSYVDYLPQVKTVWEKLSVRVSRSVGVRSDHIVGSSLFSNEFKKLKSKFNKSQSDPRVRLIKFDHYNF